MIIGCQADCCSPFGYKALVFPYHSNKKKSYQKLKHSTKANQLYPKPNLPESRVPSPLTSLAQTNVPETGLLKSKEPSPPVGKQKREDILLSGCSIYY
ncbi:hypothetical protein SAMN04490178_10754 [Propionispora vibrioides]|uniref:Uncharacterized protein n=1 Tax=Propionispora vibrioides TaxID=112903 RepID=A0A1H8TPV0_9FIRM|nr:hypothetical protein SAMN04490178_10754 [Propionispora vibrioides]